MRDRGQEPVNKTTQWRKHSEREKILHICVRNFIDVGSSILPLACIIKSEYNGGVCSVAHCTILELTSLGVQMFFINNM